MPPSSPNIETVRGRGAAMTTRLHWEDFTRGDVAIYGPRVAE
jgi:hypothetical protein